VADSDQKETFAWAENDDHAWGLYSKVKIADLVGLCASVLSTLAALAAVIGRPYEWSHNFRFPV
jgi:hypothetical protein